MANKNYKKVYDKAKELGFEVGYIRSYNGFLRLSIHYNEFRWNISNFDENGLIEQIEYIYNNEKKG